MQTDHDHAALAPHFDALRADLARHDTPAAVEQALLAAFARRHAAPPWYRRLRFWQTGALGAVGAGAALTLAFLLTVNRPEPSVAPRVAAQAPATMWHDDFIAIASLEEIADEPSPRLVQADVPYAVLEGLGLPLTPATAGEAVAAEMLVSASGQPLAMRLVYD